MKRFPLNFAVFYQTVFAVPLDKRENESTHIIFFGMTKDEVKTLNSQDVYPLNDSISTRYRRGGLAVKNTICDMILGSSRYESVSDEELVSRFQRLHALNFSKSAEAARKLLRFVDIDMSEKRALREKYDALSPEMFIAIMFRKALEWKGELPKTGLGKDSIAFLQGIYTGDTVVEEDDEMYDTQTDGLDEKEEYWITDLPEDLSDHFEEGAEFALKRLWFCASELATWIGTSVDETRKVVSNLLSYKVIQKEPGGDGYVCSTDPRGFLALKQKLDISRRVRPVQMMEPGFDATPSVFLTAKGVFFPDDAVYVFQNLAVVLDSTPITDTRDSGSHVLFFSYDNILESAGINPETMQPVDHGSTYLLINVMCPRDQKTHLKDFLRCVLAKCTNIVVGISIWNNHLESCDDCLEILKECAPSGCMIDYRGTPSFYNPKEIRFVALASGIPSRRKEGMEND